MEQREGDERARGEVRPTVGRVLLAQFGKGDKLASVLPRLEQQTHVHLPSFSRWSMVGLLEHLLHLTGPAEVWLTSWTITEDPMRSIIRMMVEGRILSIAALFDDRAPNYNAKGAQLAKANIERLAFIPIHAKVMVLMNEQWAVSVVSTANITRNKRVERYVICTHREVAEMDRDWIEKFLPSRD